MKLVCKPSREETEVVNAGQRACEMSKQALKIVQQIANDGSSQYADLFVASPAGRSAVAARFLKLVCKPSRVETEVVDLGLRDCEMGKQVLKIYLQMAGGVAFGMAWLQVRRRRGLQGGVAAGGTAKWPLEWRGCEVVAAIGGGLETF